MRDVDPDDIARFEMFGFVVLRGLLAPGEVAQLRSEVLAGLTDAFGEDLARNTRDATPLDVTVPGSFLPLMANAAPLSQALVADDPRLISVATALLGEFTVASPALGACLVGDSPWHNDAGTGERWVRVSAYLDPVTEASGALRIAPSTQHGSLPTELAGQFGGRWSRDDPVAVPAVAVETVPGDLVVFDPRVHHGSWGGQARLRWSVDYARMVGGRDAAKQARLVALINDLSEWPTTPAWPTWSDWVGGADQRTARMAAVTKLRELGVSLGPSDRT